MRRAAHHRPRRAFARGAGAVVLAAVLVAGCSVDTPRNGYTDLASGGSGLDGGPAGSDATTVDGAGSPTGPGGTAGTGGTSGSSATGGPRSQSSRAGGGGNAGGGGSTGAVGVSDSTIRITVSAPFSGYLGVIVNRAYDGGFGVWVDDVNARGGIHGRRIQVVKVDNQLTADGAIAACKEAKSNGTFMVVQVAGYAAEGTCLDQAAVPSLVYVADQPKATWKHVRYIQDVDAWGANPASYIKTKMGGGGKKVAVVYLTDLSYGYEGKDAFLQRAKEVGLNVVAVEGIVQNQGSFVAELQRIQRAGAEIVAFFGLTEILGLVRDGRAIGFTPQWTGTGFAIDEISTAGRDLLDGVVGMRVFPTTESPTYAAYRARLDQRGRGGNASTGGMGFFGVGLALEQAFAAAGRNLTRPGFEAAFDLVRNYDSGMLPAISWAGGRPTGTDATFAVVCCNPDYTWKGTGPAGTFRE